MTSGTIHPGLAAIGLQQYAERFEQNREEGKGLFVPIYDRFTEGLDTKDLKEAGALSDQLEAAT